MCFDNHIQAIPIREDGLKNRKCVTAIFTSGFSGAFCFIPILHHVKHAQLLTDQIWPIWMWKPTVSLKAETLWLPSFVLFCFLYRTKTARTTAPKLGFISVLFSLIITLKQMAPGDMQISQLPGLSLCGIFAWCNWPAANKTKWVWTPTHAQSAGRTNAISAVYFVYCASLFCVCDTE